MGKMFDGDTVLRALTTPPRATSLPSLKIPTNPFPGTLLTLNLTGNKISDVSAKLLADCLRNSMLKEVRYMLYILYCMIYIHTKFIRMHYSNTIIYRI